MLQTNLEHVESEEDFRKLTGDNEKVVVCCGRMGPMCIPVYGIFEALLEKYPDIQFRDMEFDHPAARVIRDLPECLQFRGLPFTVYFRDGKVVRATSSIQTAGDVKSIIKEVFA